MTWKKGGVAWNKGLTKETDMRVKKCSITRTGRKNTEEHKRNTSLGLLNMSEEAKAERSRKQSLAMKGKPSWLKGLTKETDERVRKYSLSKIGKKRKPFSDEWKKNMSLAQIGKKHGPHSDEAKRKMSLALIGENHPMWHKHHKKETVEKMHLAQVGKKKSKEHCENIKKARARQVIPFRDTQIEVALQNILRSNNIPFKTHVPLVGQPDIFIEPNICVFADGDYWHANPDTHKADDIMFKCRLAQDIWENDKKVTDGLISKGYRVIRFWEKDIKSNIQDCFNKIVEKIVT